MLVHGRRCKYLQLGLMLALGLALAPTAHSAEPTTHMPRLPPMLPKSEKMEMAAEVEIVSTVKLS